MDIVSDRFFSIVRSDLVYFWQADCEWTDLRREVGIVLFQYQWGGVISGINWKIFENRTTDLCNAEYYTSYLPP